MPLLNFNAVDVLLVAGGQMYHLLASFCGRPFGWSSGALFVPWVSAENGVKPVILQSESVGGLSTQNYIRKLFLASFGHGETDWGCAIVEHCVLILTGLL